MKTGLPTSGKCLFLCHWSENLLWQLSWQLSWENDLKFLYSSMYSLSNIENWGVHTLVLNKLVSSH